jgi:hypothetical protein
MNAFKLGYLHLSPFEYLKLKLYDQQRAWNQSGNLTINHENLGNMGQMTFDGNM